MRRARVRKAVQGARWEMRTSIAIAGALVAALLFPAAGGHAPASAEAAAGQHVCSAEDRRWPAGHLRSVSRDSAAPQYRDAAGADGEPRAEPCEQRIRVQPQRAPEAAR